MAGETGRSITPGKNVKIQVKDVKKEYHGDHGTTVALNGVNLDIMENEFICVVGPSGCGKSTLLNILAGLHEASSGECYLDGELIKGTDVKRGVVFQRYAMGLARAMELLALGQEREGCAAWRALCGMICENEPKYQPYLDVYRVQEVTENYTGFCGLEAGERNSMRHEYYYYSKEQLLASPRLPITVMADNAAVFQTMAREMADEIKRKNALGEKTVFICPVGPVGQYPYFVDMVNKENISLKNVWFLNMDEYLTDDKAWISKDHPLSFRGFMDRKVYTKIKPELVMPEEQRIFPDPKDPENMWRTIQALGGVDICFGGIGINGHVAFNEAQDELTADQFRALPTRVLAISRETRTANAIGDFNGAVDDMPRWCVTIGMREICSAKKIRLGCFRDWHRAVVRYACCGEVSAHFPVTLLQEHPDTLLRVTEFVANLPE